MRSAFTCAVLMFVCLPFCSYCQTGQDSSSIHSEAIKKLSGKYISSIDGKSEKLSDQLDQKTEKYLSNLAKQEERMKRKLSKIDSIAAKNIFSGSERKYQQLQDDLKNKSNNLLKGSGQYIPWIDSASTSLRFLASNPALGKLSSQTARIKTAIGKVHALEDQFKQAENVQEFIRQRKEYLKQQLQNYNLGSELKKYNQQAYYYFQQVNDFKMAWDDPSKLEQKTLALLNQLPAFRDFMKKNSMLAGLFNIPDDYGTSGVAGLQTRDAVQQLMGQQMTMMGPNGAQTAQQNISGAQSSLTQLRDKFMKTGTGGETPDFKPNDQKTKKFLHKLEYGMNLQTAHSTYYFPTTTDIGLSAGYKLNDKSTIGIGVSGKIGWGSDIHHIAVTGQGLGLRSFADVKLKGNFYASAGFEYNYQHAFSSLQQVHDLSVWQRSGLIGISKMVSLRGKLIKKTKLQLLWDFLSYSQMPRTQPIKFRIGYNF